MDLGLKGKNVVLPGFTATPLFKKNVEEGLISGSELDRLVSGILERRTA